MEPKILYCYEREDGGITVSPNKPDCEYTERYRLVANEGKSWTKDGVELYCVIDVDSIEGWYEVDIPENDIEKLNQDEIDTQ